MKSFKNTCKVTQVITEHITPAVALRYLDGKVATESPVVFWLKNLASFFQKEVVFDEGKLVKGQRLLLQIVRSNQASHLRVVRNFVSEDAHVPASTVELDDDDLLWPADTDDAALSDLDIALGQETVPSEEEDGAPHDSESDEAFRRLEDEFRHLEDEEILSPMEQGTFLPLEDEEAEGLTEDVRSDFLSLASRIESGRFFCVYKDSQRIHLYYKHKDAVEFLRPLTSMHLKGVSSASICAVIGRAWYTQNRRKLHVIMDILSGKITSGVPGAPKYLMETLIKFRSCLMMEKKSKKREDYYAYFQALVWAFLNNYTKKIELVADREIFPIPSDEDYPKVVRPAWSRPKPAKKPSAKATCVDGFVDHSGTGRLDLEMVPKAELEDFANLWWITFGDEPVLAKDLVRMCDQLKVFHHLTNKIGPKQQTRSVWLSKNVLSIMAGQKLGSSRFYWLRKYGAAKNVWKLQVKSDEKA